MTKEDLYFIPLHARLDAIIAWQAHCSKHMPECPNCGEEHQIQLRDALEGGGPLWKCRMCRHRFHFSPPLLTTRHK